MRILVTGGAGYVGSHVVLGLLEAGHEPVVYDNLSTGHAQAVTVAELVVADIRDAERLSAVLQQGRFDGVVHLAALSLVGESVRDPASYFHNNVVGSVTLLNGLVHAEVPWMVLSSTAAVYGAPECLPIPEEHPKHPGSPYGESKLMLERALAWYEQAYGFRSIALRYFNAAGAHPSGTVGEDHDPETHLVPIVLQAAAGRRPPVQLFGTDYPTPDGTAVRDYVHVCDLADAHVTAVGRLSGGGPSGAYNLGCETGYSVREIIDATQKVTGCTVPMQEAPRRAGDPALLVAQTSHVRQQMGWIPRFDLRGILETAWEWHRTHPNGYKG